MPRAGSSCNAGATARVAPTRNAIVAGAGLTTACRYETIAHTTRAVIARYEAIAYTTKKQGYSGDCFVPRSDGRCCGCCPSPRAGLDTACRYKAIAYTTRAAIERSETIAHTTRAVIERYETIAHTTRAVIERYEAIAYTTRTVIERYETIAYTTRTVIERYETIAYTTKKQGCPGDCFVPRSDGRCCGCCPS
jgi:hypothetical protein